MEFHLKVVDGAKPLTLLEAMRLGKIVPEEIGLHSETVKILRSTSLLDLDENEIFEEDIVVDEQGRKYCVTYKNGAFFAVSYRGDAPKSIPLHLLQGNGYVPIKIFKKN